MMIFPDINLRALQNENVIFLEIEIIDLLTGIYRLLYEQIVFERTLLALDPFSNEKKHSRSGLFFIW